MIAYLDSVSAASPDTEDVTTPAMNTTGATLLVASISSYGDAGPTTISDSKGNTWSPGTVLVLSAVRLRFWYVSSPTVGSGHTFTTVNASPNYPSISVAAFSGAKASAAFDQENGNLNAGVATSTIAPGSVTPTEDNELVVTAAWLATGLTTVSVAGCTLLEENEGLGGAHFGNALAYAIQTTATPVNPLWTFDISSTVAVNIATFKVAVAVDTTPPVLSAGSPSGTLAAGTTSTTLTVTTNEAATCKWGTVASTAYASLPNTFSTTGGTSHSTTMSGLADGTSYTVYVRAQDAAGNPTLTDYAIPFAVAAAEPVGPATITFHDLVNRRNALMRADSRVTVILARPGVTTDDMPATYLVKDPDPGDNAGTAATAQANAKGGQIGGRNLAWKEYSYADLGTAYGLEGSAPSGEADIIAASTWRWDGNSGTVLVSSGFPLQPGQVTSATVSEVRVYVAGVEKAVAIHPLDGVFPDGSYRSLGIQFSHNLTHDTPISSEVHVNTGTARGTVDLTWVDPTRATHVLKKAVIAPTSPTHLCGTCVTLTPLTPATNDTGVAATWAAWAASQWAFSQVANGQNAGTAIYDHVVGLMNLYCRTGTRSWYQYAYDWATGFAGDTGLYQHPTTPGTSDSQGLTLLEYLLPTADTTPDSESTWNPENLTQRFNTGGTGSPTEAYGYGRYLSLASAYWMTAYRQFKRLLAKEANLALYGTETNYATWRDRMSVWYGQRFNLRYLYAPVLAGYLTGCTTGFVTPGGYPAVTNWDYATYLDWALDAMEHHIWTLPGDYRNGLVGQRHTTIDPVVSGNPAANEAWGITNFQLALMAEWLMLYYDHVKPDSRIPTWLGTIGAYLIAQSRQSLTGLGTDSVGHTADTGYPTTWCCAYINHPPPVTGLVDDSDVQDGSQYYLTGWYLAMFPSLFAWLSAYTGNGTYQTWADRAAVTENSNLTLQTKNWGEFFGGTRQAYLYYRAGGTVRGTTGVHPTVITNPPVQPTLG